ncbi:glycine--tRNA ligase subunit beta [Roseibacterium beibuensis]|uniref:glycine--tRNA ligase subunit beta n=1 Tax=[Roseibacterium] beibuensis TaxID=1193142 RepID=UPI00217D6532|nr:glycine--tRNA ligase subunit beta [Roseibacterium beibuensis]MCS6622707.1 glycine--tRNA ligase subunit beta [Roseibacterium beibuensis]
MPQLLLELFSEEIPARMQSGAARDLERMAADRLKAAGLSYDALTTFAGPRRLTLVVEGLPAATPDREEELKGPKTSAPEQALDGFLRKTGLTRDQLVERDGVFFAAISQKGRATADLIPDMVDQIVRGFPWPKSMRWGSGTLRWVRPLKRIVALFDGQVVPFDIDGVQSGDVTEGHRFLGSGKPFAVRDFADYRAKLEREHVLLDVADRKLRILEAAQKVCSNRGLALVDDDGLLDEVAGLAEWPTPILGDMDPQFLDLPPEVVQLSMKVHQKYFAVRDPATHRLAPHFVVVANVEASDGGKALAAGNSRVLSARLNDARFFWDEDLKTGFAAWNDKLKGVTFHAKLGTLAERVDRIAALAREIAPLVGADPDQAETAARLSKADLASAMVGEFPELQGVMGGYYAKALLLEGEGLGWGGGTPPQDMAHEASSKGRPSPPASTDNQPASTPPNPPPRGEGYRDALADAVRDHYRPQGPGDAVPTAPLTVAVALADKLDTLVGFFAIDEKPTGSKDPFALRRAALGVIRLVLENGLRLPLEDICEFAMRRAGPERPVAIAEWTKAAINNDAGRKMNSEIEVGYEVVAFFADRLKVLLRDQGKRHDLVDAVFALGDDDLVRIVRRVEALDAFLATDDGANLLAGYKRASNILRAEEKKGPLPAGEPVALTGAPAEETALIVAAAAGATAVDAALQTEDFAAAMQALAALRAPVDAVFTAVMVNSDVAEERDNRLKLLGQVRAVMGRVADFGMISG